MKETSIGGDKGHFPKTHWDMILSPNELSEREYKEKMGMLINMYWKPVYKYIRYAWNKSNEDAKDLTQAFFVRFMRKNDLQKVSPQRGRFRTFVKVALKHFLIEDKEKRQTQKRGGGKPTVSVEKTKGEITGDETKDPADYFDKEWAMEVLNRAITSMKEALVKQDKETYSKIFDKFYFTYNASHRKEIAQEFNITEADVKNRLRYCRKLIKSIMKEEVKLYVLGPSETEEELNFILAKTLSS